MTSDWEVAWIEECKYDNENDTLFYKVAWKSAWLDSKAYKQWENDIAFVKQTKYVKKKNKNKNQTTKVYFVDFRKTWMHESDLQNCETFMAAFNLLSIKHQPFNANI